MGSVCVKGEQGRGTQTRAVTLDPAGITIREPVEPVSHASTSPSSNSEHLEPSTSAKQLEEDREDMSEPSNIVIVLGASVSSEPLATFLKFL